MYGIIVFWAFMAALFVRHEIIPTLFDPPTRGYAGIRAYAQTHAAYKMDITTEDGTNVGWARVSYDVRKNGECEIVSESELKLASLARQPWLAKAAGALKWPKLWVRSHSTIGPDGALQTFSVSFNADVISGRAVGTVDGDTLKIKITSGGETTEVVVPATKGDFVSTGVMALGALPDLHVEQTWRIRMLSPFAFEFTDADVKVTKKTTINLRGHDYDVFEVETTHDLVNVTTWVDDTGNVLRERVTMLGFALISTRKPLPHEPPKSPDRAPAEPTP